MINGHLPQNILSISVAFYLIQIFKERDIYRPRKTRVKKLECPYKCH